MFCHSNEKGTAIHLQDVHAPLTAFVHNGESQEPTLLLLQDCEPGLAGQLG